MKLIVIKLRFICEIFFQKRSLLKNYRFSFFQKFKASSPFSKTKVFFRKKKRSILEKNLNITENDRFFR